MNAQGGKAGGTDCWDLLGARIARLSARSGISIDGPCRIGGDLGPGTAYAVWIPEDGDERSGLQLTAENPARLLEKLKRYLGSDPG